MSVAFLNELVILAGGFVAGCAFCYWRSRVAETELDKAIGALDGVLGDIEAQSPEERAADWNYADAEHMREALRCFDAGTENAEVSA